MTDPLSLGLRAATSDPAWATALLFAAGAASGVGPCLAPRYVAVAALAGGARRPILAAAPFAAGVVVAYVTLGTALGAIAMLTASSTITYAVLAVTLSAAGIAVLVRAPHHCARRRETAGAGGAFLLGVGSSLVVSPCCTPVIGAVAGLTLLGGRAFEGTLLLAGFAAGHVTPVFVAAFAARWTRAIAARCATPWAARFAAARASSVIGGTLLVALGIFYGALA